ncbi:MAG: flagellar assembly protein FliW [Deltaproteobacteria bacterium]|nr:flagellar assembly protein FliW [Deltaproteobacteria bacterium]
MKVLTSRFGTIDIDEGQIIHMPNGMIGFPDEKRYVLLEHRKGSPFFWFQSVDNGSLAFVLIDPLTFKPDYEIEIDPEDSAALELSHASNGIQTLTVVNISSNPPAEITANLLAPIVFNVSRRRAKQIALYQSPYSWRHPVSTCENKKP